MDKLSTAEKTELLCKVMAGLGISANDFMNQFKEDEPEPIIKESGETWVARFDGVDWLYIGNGLNPSFDIKHVFPENVSWWKPFSEIEITDEIAKLRPMVKCSCGCNVVFKLYGVGTDDLKNNFIGFDHTSENKDYTGWTSVILATVQDLS